MGQDVAEERLNHHRTRLLLGVLVERLGGTVTMTARELMDGLAANGGSFVVEIKADQITIDIFPKGYGGEVG